MNCSSLYNYHSDVKLLSCQFWGCLASMCEATSPPPCELAVKKTVNKPLVVNINQGAWSVYRPLPRSLDITHPPTGPLKVRSGLQLHSVVLQSAAIEGSRTIADKRRQDGFLLPSLCGKKSYSSVSARACLIRRAVNAERRVAATITEPREPPGSRKPSAWPWHGAPSSSLSASVCS